MIVRDPARLAPETRERVEVVQGSHDDPDVVDQAFEGAEAVFWLVPPNPRATSLEAAYLDFTRPACEAFRAVASSASSAYRPWARGVSDNAGLVTRVPGDGRPDRRQRASTYRALTMPSFMDNLLRQVASIRDQGVFFSPLAGDRRNPTCATRDIAAVAARLLLDRSWSGQGSVAVLGPEDLSFDDMARIMSEVLGKPVRFQQIPGDAFKAGLIKAGWSEAMAQGTLDMMRGQGPGPRQRRAA